ncbi:hypothetical protein ES703_50149 [subsurface metagenome]
MVVTSGTTSFPSDRTMKEVSFPLKHSSTRTLLPASPNFLSTMIRRTTSSASFRFSQIMTPFPAANPSAFTTTGKENFPEFKISFASSGDSAISHPAVGILWRSMNCLANTLLPSNSAVLLSGPNIFKPLSSNSSTMPIVKGNSGPTTVKPIFSFAAKSASPWISEESIATFSAMLIVPGFPGAQKSFSRWGL